MEKEVTPVSLPLLLFNKHTIFAAALKTHDPGQKAQPAACHRTQNKMTIPAYKKCQAK